MINYEYLNNFIRCRPIHGTDSETGNGALAKPLIFQTLWLELSDSKNLSTSLPRLLLLP